MPFTSNLVRLLGVLALSLTAGASPVTADLANDLVMLNREARGGREACAALRGLRATGVTRIEGRELGFILYAARPRSLRIETLGDTGTLVRAFDGVHAPWQKGGLLAPPTRLSAAAESDFLMETDFDDPLHEPAARGITLEDAGRAVVEGRPCRKLLATVRLTEAFTLYLDEETFLLIRRDHRKRVGTRNIVVETHYSEHRAVGGVLLPHRIRTQIGDRVVTETLITEMDANPTLPPDFFAPPAAGWPKR